MTVSTAEEMTETIKNVIRNMNFNDILINGIRTSLE